jgi:hypothetical protein
MLKKPLLTRLQPESILPASSSLWRLIMDGSLLPPDKRFVLLDNQIADAIEDLHPEDLTFLADLISSIRNIRDCECGCRGRSHITVTTPDARTGHLVGRLRRREPATPDFEAQFRVSSFLSPPPLKIYNNIFTRVCPRLTPGDFCKALKEPFPSALFD